MYRRMCIQTMNIVSLTIFYLSFSKKLNLALQSIKPNLAVQSNKLDSAPQNMKLNSALLSMKSKYDKAKYTDWSAA